MRKLGKSSNPSPANPYFLSVNLRRPSVTPRFARSLFPPSPFLLRPLRLCGESYLSGVFHG
jgi:hypothetical protein